METNKDVDYYVTFFRDLYEPTQNCDRSFHQMLCRMNESVAKCSQYLNRALEWEQIPLHLPSLFAWYCALFSKATHGYVELSTILWEKYPAVCPYCLQSTCQCKAKKAIQLNNNKARLEDLCKRNISLKPTTLSGWQQLFAKIYPRNNETSLSNDIRHLMEELGEVSAAYRINYKYKDSLKHELSDVFTWIIGIANVINSMWGDRGESEKNIYSLEKEIFKRYENGCPKCKKSVCMCLPNVEEQTIAEKEGIFGMDKDM